MSTKACFPTLVYFDFLKKPKTSLLKLCANIEDEIEKIRDNDMEGQEWSEENFVGGYTSYSSISNLHEISSTFINFKKLVDKHIINFSKDLEHNIDSKQLQMSSCWINIVPPGCFHSLHLHPLSVISGSFYIKTPAHSGQLRLEDPRLSKFMASPPKKDEASFKNQHQLYFKPSPGKIILFESWLRHEVEQNHSNANRISISFNYGWNEA